jgi:hypothetical protein
MASRDKAQHSLTKLYQPSMIAALYSLLVLCVTNPASSSFAKYLDHPILQLV